MAVKKIGDDAECAKKVTHRDCGSVLEYLESDVQKYDRTDYTGVTDTYRYIVCPACGERCYVGR